MREQILRASVSPPSASPQLSSQCLVVGGTGVLGGSVSPGGAPTVAKCSPPIARGFISECDLELWPKFPQIQELAFINSDVGCQVMVAAVKSFLGVFWACWGGGGSPCLHHVTSPTRNFPPAGKFLLENSIFRLTGWIFPGFLRFQPHVPPVPPWLGGNVTVPKPCHPLQ